MKATVRSVCVMMAAVAWCASRNAAGATVLLTNETAELAAFTMTGGTLDVFSGTNLGDGYGARLRVAGDISITGHAWLRPNADFAAVASHGDAEW